MDVATETCKVSRCQWPSWEAFFNLANLNIQEHFRKSRRACDDEEAKDLFVREEYAISTAGVLRLLLFWSLHRLRKDGRAMLVLQLFLAQALLPHAATEMLHLRISPAVASACQDGALRGQLLRAPAEDPG